MKINNRLKKLLSKEQIKLIELLDEGQENRKTPEYLRSRLYLSDRALRSLIEKTRQYIPILSSTKSGGYYLPAKGQQGKVEARRFLQSQESIAKSCIASCVAVKEFLGEEDRQVRFDI